MANNIPERFTEITDEEERAFDWDDEITSDGQDFVLLPEGDYDFEVVSFERGQHPGSEKLPPCKKAIVHIKVTDGKNSTTIIHNFFLHSRTEGMIGAFLVSIGQKKHDEPTRPRWKEMVGAKGRCKVVIDEFTGRNGDTLQSNKIRKFYKPAENPPAPQQTTFRAGTF